MKIESNRSDINRPKRRTRHKYAKYKNCPGKISKHLINT